MEHRALAEDFYYLFVFFFFDERRDVRLGRHGLFRGSHRDEIRRHFPERFSV